MKCDCAALDHTIVQATCSTWQHRSRFFTSCPAWCLSTPLHAQQYVNACLLLQVRITNYGCSRIVLPALPMAAVTASVSSMFPLTTTVFFFQSASTLATPSTFVDKAVIALAHPPQVMSTLYSNCDAIFARAPRGVQVIFPLLGLEGGERDDEFAIRKCRTPKSFKSSVRLATHAERH